MLRVLIVVAVVVAALLRGGSLAGFARLQIRQMPLVLGSLLVQLLIFPLSGGPLLPAGLTAALYLLSMAILVWWVWLNRSLPGITLIGAGVIMNLVTIAANGGYMPVDPDAVAYAGRMAAYSGEPVANNSLATDGDVRLWLLTDIFPVPAGIPFANVYSLGDILLTTGASILCYRAVSDRPADRVTTKGATDEHRLPAA